MRQHQRGLLVYAQSLMAAAGRRGDHAAVEDLVQDSLVVAYENLHRFDHSREFSCVGARDYAFPPHEECTKSRALG